MEFPDYSRNDPKGWSGDPKRGASLGRPKHYGDREKKYQLFISEVELVDGYDVNGTYFGDGMQLYWVADLDNEVDYCFRAPDYHTVTWYTHARYPHGQLQEGPRISVKS